MNLGLTGQGNIKGSNTGSAVAIESFPQTTPRGVHNSVSQSQSEQLERSLENQRGFYAKEPCL